VCRTCWKRGPGDRDVIELQDELWWWQFDKEELGRGMSEFLVEFVRYVGADRKAWSHHGMLPSLLPSDPRGRADAGGRWTFDPTNRVYGSGTRAVPAVSHAIGMAIRARRRNMRGLH
jgi:hypothetical protein